MALPVLAQRTLSVLMEVCDFEQTFVTYMSKHLQPRGDADKVLTGSASSGSLSRVITESILILSDLTVAPSGKWSVCRTWTSEQSLMIINLMAVTFRCDDQQRNKAVSYRMCALKFYPVHLPTSLQFDISAIICRPLFSSSFSSALPPFLYVPSPPFPVYCWLMSRAVVRVVIAAPAP